MDSQSDWSANLSPPVQRKIMQVHQQLESDTDTEENIREVLNNSHKQLNYTNNIYSNQFTLGLNEYLVTNNIVSIII